MKTDLLEEAMRLGQHKTKEEAVYAALEVYVRQLKRASLRALIGRIDFHPDFDHRAVRRPRTR